MAGVLSYRDIEEAVEALTIEVDPIAPDAIQPASIDITLGDYILTVPPDITEVDPYDPPSMKLQGIPSDGYLLRPGQFALGVTFERIRLGHSILGRIEGRSSLGRLGLAVHITAGFIDPGWNGHLTLELLNVMPVPFRIHSYMPIGQIAFEEMRTPAPRGYGSPRFNSKYAGDALYQLPRASKGVAPYGG